MKKIFLCIFGCFLVLGCVKERGQPNVIKTFFYKESMDSIFFPIGKKGYYMSVTRGDTLIFNADSTITEKWLHLPNKTLTKRLYVCGQYSYRGYKPDDTYQQYPQFNLMMYVTDTVGSEPNSFIACLYDTIYYWNLGIGRDPGIIHFDHKHDDVPLYFPN